MEEFDLDFFYRVPKEHAPMALPRVWPNVVDNATHVAYKHIAQALNEMCSTRVFMDIVVNLLHCHDLWYKRGTPDFKKDPYDAAVIVAKRLVHVCYDMRTGNRNDVLLEDAHQYAHSVRDTRKSFHTSLNMKPVFAEPASQFTVHDALNVLVFLDVCKHASFDVVGTCQDAPTDNVVPHTIFETAVYAIDHFLACLDGFATVFGSIAYRHWSNLDSMPRAPDRLALGYVRKGPKLPNYLSSVVTCFITMAHVVRCLQSSKNEAFRILCQVREVVLDNTLLRGLKEYDPAMQPLMILFGNLVLRMYGAFLQLPKEGHAMIRHHLSASEMCAPNVVEHDIPRHRQALGMAHMSVLLCGSTVRLYLIITDKMLWKRTGLDEIYVKQDISVPSWCMSEDDLRAVARETVKKKTEVEINNILKEFQ
jgi:hypothetical protein